MNRYMYMYMVSMVHIIHVCKILYCYLNSTSLLWTCSYRVIRAILNVSPRVLVISDDCGDIPLHVACVSGQVAVVKVLLQHVLREGGTDEGKRCVLDSLEARSVPICVYHIDMYMCTCMHMYCCICTIDIKLLHAWPIVEIQ